MTSHDAPTAYAELDTPQELHDDCEAMKTNMPFLRTLTALAVPAQRLYDPATAKQLAAKPVIAVSAVAKGLADRFNPLDGSH